ncbi:MAG: transposase [Bacteroidales bacterium]|jgi:putative transposase|nr:transposase [Bacteroidales bacterium]
MSQGCKIIDQDGVHFMTFQIIEWVDLFTRQNYRDIIIDSLRFCQKHKGLTIYAWVVMSNHIHIILQSETNKLSDTVKEFKSFTAKGILRAINEERESRREWMLNVFKFAAKKHKRNEHYQIWTHDNHPELIFSNTFLDQKINYIHDNPVRAGIVGQEEDYLYSSARDYAGEKGLLDVFFLDPSLEKLGSMRSVW